MVVSRRLRWVRALAIGTMATLAVGLSAWGLLARRAAPEEGMEPIRKAIAAQRWPEAERRLVAWVGSHPDDGNARVMLAALLLGRQREGDAREALLAVREEDPARSKAQSLLGEMALRGRLAAEAERAYRDAAARDPKAVEPRRKLIYLLSIQQRTGEVRDLLWELYAIGRDPRLLIDLVMELWAFENDARSPGTELGEFLAKTPADPYLRRARGLSLLLGGKAPEALPDLEAAAEALTDDPVGRFALAECRLMLGTFQGDESILGPRPTPPADAARWWLLRGRLQDLLKRPADAVASFREAVAANPDDVEAQYRLGHALVQAGSKPEGQAHLDRSEEIRRRHAEVRREHTNLRRQGFEADATLFERHARLCLDIGLAAEARAWLELAVRADPGRPSARAALAGLADDRRPLPFPLTRPRRGAKGEIPSIGPAAVAGPRTNAEPRFEEIASRSGIPFRYDPGAKGDLFLGDTMGGGVGLIDYDGDGRLDVYFVNGSQMPYDPASPPRPNRLYRNLGDGSFEDVTEKAGVPGRGDGMGCVVGDYDDDGDDDLFVTGLGATVLYRNRGDGTFEDVTAEAGVASDRWTTAAGFGDMDGDGDLDLVVVTYVAIDPRNSPECRDHSGGRIHCSPSLFPAQSDHLFRNNGDGTFTDVAAEAGFEGPEGRGLGLAIADLDEDGRLDLFVANDASPCFAFRNLGGLKFEEVGMTCGLAVNGAGKPTAAMGVVADDLDGDGRLDIFVTNFLNEPNTLFRGLGGGVFSDSTTAANLHAPSIPMTGFGTAALDVDRDGILDLFVANGHVDDQPWINSPMAQLPHLFLGRGGGRFELTSPACPELRTPTVGRGVAAGDLDNDGRVDLILVNRDAPVYLLRNTTEGGHWLGLRLVGGPSGRTPVGARVTCRAGGKSQVHWVTSGTSYLSVNDPRLWFGLGPQARVESLEIRWPSGAVQTWTDLPADQILEVVEGNDPRAIGGH